MEVRSSLPWLSSSQQLSGEGRFFRGNFWHAGRGEGGVSDETIISNYKSSFHSKMATTNKLLVGLLQWPSSALNYTCEHIRWGDSRSRIFCSFSANICQHVSNILPLFALALVPLIAIFCHYLPQHLLYFANIFSIFCHNICNIL